MKNGEFYGFHEEIYGFKKRMKNEELKMLNGEFLDCIIRFRNLK